MHLPRTPAEALDRSHLAGPPDDTVTPALSSAGITTPAPAAGTVTPSSVAGTVTPSSVAGTVTPPSAASTATPSWAAGIAAPPSAAAFASGGEDPGYLDLDDVDEKAVDTLDAAVAAGEFPAFARVRIL